MIKNTFLFFTSLLLVAFGQQTWVWQFGLLSAFGGFALFWMITMHQIDGKARFWLAALWFTLIQMIQLSWTLSHLYFYMVAVYLIVCIFYGLQFGLLSYFIESKRIKPVINLFALSGLWVFLEWMRLFFLPKLSWNPVGIALATTTAGSQLTTVGGVFLLSFVVILMNLFLLRYLAERKRVNYLAYSAVCLFPFVFGWMQMHRHSDAIQQSEKIPVLLVQTGTDVVEKVHFDSLESYRRFAMEEWKKIILLIQAASHPLELVVLPENSLPFSAYQAAYPFEEVKAFFLQNFNQSDLSKMPALSSHLAVTIEGKTYVNNAYFAQAVANIFNTNLIVGMEDRDVTEQETKHYSAALLFQSVHSPFQRYSKRILVPMGEYIPFDWCQELCKQYGIYGSFTPGNQANLLYTRNHAIGVSICYEETFGDWMRQSRQQGAQLHANLTNDGWYPHSHLPESHFEHGRLRAIEQGIPMVRSCNTGVTCAVDSLGRTIDVLRQADGSIEEGQGALQVLVPMYSYDTPYTEHGDALVLALSGFSMLGSLIVAYFFKTSSPE